MLTPNRELMAEARKTLTGKWQSSVATVLIFFAISISLTLIVDSSLIGHDKNKDKEYMEFVRNVEDTIKQKIYNLTQKLNNDSSYMQEDNVCGGVMEGNLSGKTCGHESSTMHEMDKDEHHDESSWLLEILVSLLVKAPLTLGLTMYFLAYARNNTPKLETLFSGFRQYGTIVYATLFRNIYIILFTLLFIVPGIIMAISYAQVYYIIADDPSLKPTEALQISKKIMQGNKAKYFGLCIRFVGWILLCIITLGIGLLWVTPYFMVSQAKFYEDVKAHYLAGENQTSV